MKTLPPILIAIGLAATTCAAQDVIDTKPAAATKITAEESSGVPTYTPAQFAKEVGADPKDGELVKIRFNGRSSFINNGPNGTKVGRLEAREPGQDLEVQVPPEGMSWFEHLVVFTYQVYDRLNAKSYVVYGRVKTGKNGNTSVRLIGTEIKHDDLDGDSIIWH